MGKGIIYITTTSVTGLIKIGKTDNFGQRMAGLEQNGYWNVSGLKRFYAVEVEDYDEKEKLIHTIFSKSQVANSELFALDKELAKRVLESFGGKQIYPVPCEKDEAASKVSEDMNTLAPNGKYYLKRRIKSIGKEINAVMQIENGKFIVLAGSDFSPVSSDGISDAIKERRKNAKVRSGKLLKDETFSSSSYAAVFVLGQSESGPRRWKDKDGKSLREYMLLEE